MSSDMSRVHDMGGHPSEEPIDQSTHEWADWEHLTNALIGALRNHDLMNVDELRRGIESMDTDEYRESTYYERWSASLETLLVEKGILTTDEIDSRVEQVDERWE